MAGESKGSQNYELSSYWHFGRCRLIGNNKSIHEYSKFHIQSEFSRNRSSFSQSSSPGAY
ncbi:hypothetical protein R6Q59_031203 [Mikania micrantha]